MPNPKLFFYGGVGATTGANFLLECGNKPASAQGYGGQRKILIDCGLRQGRREEEEENFKPFPYDPKEINFLLVTHAHLDHIGKIPKLARDGFRGKIISTAATLELAGPMLRDALKVFNIKHPEKILFEEQDIQKSLDLWRGFDYGEKIDLFDNCSLLMQNSGHILGSAILNVELTPPNSPIKLREGQEGSYPLKISFTGDLGNSPSPLLPDSEFIKDADYIVIESVYGDRDHESKKERREKLKHILSDGIRRGGEIVIPAFSLERTQVLIYEINNMVEGGEIPSVPVFLDSPLALQVTDIYKKHMEDFKKTVREEIAQGDDIFDFLNLHLVKSAEESEEISKIKGPKIIIAGSGMSEGGRVLNHESRILNHPENTLILIGYQGVGTLGRKLEEGVKEIEIRDTSNEKRNTKKQIKVRAKIETIKGYSSHKDSEHLVEFVDQTNQNHKLKQVFVCMGEPHSSLFFAQRLRDYLDIEAVYPEVGKEYELN